MHESARTSVVVDAITVDAVVDVLVRVNVTSVVVLGILLESVLQNVALVLLVVGIRSVITVADLVTFHVIARILVQISRNGVIIVNK